MNEQTLAKTHGRNGYLIVCARFLSDTGAFMNMVALSSYIYLLSDSAIAVGIFLACRVSGGIVSSFTATRLFRHFMGKWPLVSLDVLRASAILLLLLLPEESHITMLPVIGFLLGLASSWFAIGINSQLASFVGIENLGKVNSWITTLSSIGMVMGSLTSGLIIAWLGYEIVFMANIVAYLLAGACILILQGGERKEQPSATTEKQGFLQDFALLKMGLKQAPMIAAMLIVTLADTLGSASHNVGFPIISEIIDSIDPSKIMGYLVATWAIGRLLGATIARAAKLLDHNNLSQMEFSFFVGVALMSSGFITGFNQSELYFCMAAFFVAGIGDGISETTFITRIQVTPADIRLPLLSLMTFIQTSGFGIGMVLCSFVFEILPPGQVVGIFHGIPLVLVVFARIWATRRELTIGPEANS